MAQTVIFEEQTLDGFEYSSAFGVYTFPRQSVPVDLTIGETYRIVWDGVTYNCKAEDGADLAGDGTVLLGNTAYLLGVTGKDEPFIIAWFNHTGEDPASVMIGSLDTNASHTVAIYQVEENDNANQTVILAEQRLETWTHDESMGVYVIQYDGIFALEVGVVYTVIWDGKPYSYTSYVYNDGGLDITFLGNEGFVTGETAELIDPFVVAYVTGADVCAFYSLDDQPHTIAIYQGELEPEPEPDVDLVLKDRHGQDLEGINGVVEIKIPTADGGFKSFLNGERVEKILTPDEVNFSEGDIVVTPTAGEMFGKVTVPKPPTLLPENIMEGVTIAGVDGTAKSGGDEPSLTKPIRFYNAYGDVIYSFTRAEIAKMSELPEGPALGNLTFYDWDYTLDELKNELYFCEVSPKYKNASGQAVAVMIVENLDVSRILKIYYYLNSNSYYACVDWGDGTTTRQAGSTSYTSRPYFSHTYSDPGTYIISMYGETTTVRIGGGPTNSYTYSVTVEGISASNVSIGNGAIPGKRLISLLGNKDAKAYAYWCGVENNLRFVSGIDGNEGNTGYLLNCGSLKTIGRIYNAIGSSWKFGGQHMLNACASLTRVKVTKTYENMFDYCTSLKEVEIDGTGTLTYPYMNVKFSLLITRTTPPTISAASPVWGTKPIYVPDEAVEAYRTADGWSNVAAYIFPASTYPDK